MQTFARERRVELSYDEFPPLVVHAFISAEDKTFFKHGGIDYHRPGRRRVRLRDARASAAAGPGRIDDHPAGRQISAEGHSYTIGRKIREAILAFRLESTLSKQQILELYLNSIFLGRNAYGVQAASRAYFDKDVNELTLPEAAYLAVLPKAPANYDPVRATQRALDRRNYVLREMERNGYITADQRAAAAATPLGTIRYGSSEKFRQQGGYFMEEVRRELIKQFGEESDKGPNSLYAGGLWVRSSMVPSIQDAAAQALRDGLTKFDGGRGWRDLELSIDLAKGDWAAQLDRAPVGVGYPDWRKAVVLSKSGGQAMIGFTNGSTGSIPVSGASMPVRGVGGNAFDALRPGMVVIVKELAPGSYGLRSVPEISGGMLVEEVHTGRVMAMQGGFDVVGSSYNRATQALRQPGSAFKPIVYITALANGMTPASIIVDAPFCVWQGAGLGNKCFVNFDRRYAGPHTMRWGVEQSRNLMTVRAASETGMPKVIDTAPKLGVGNYPNYLSIALGAGDTTVLRLVNAYAILANQGRSVKPTTIDYVAGSQWQGHLSHRQPLRGDGQLQRARLGWQADAAAAEPDQATGRSDGGVPDGPHHGRRDRARHRDRASRPRSSAVRQDRHHVRADQRLVRRRHAGHRRRHLHGLRPARARWAAMRRAGGSRLRSSSNGRRPRSRTSPRCRSLPRPESAGSGSIAPPASACSGCSPLRKIQSPG